MGAVIHSVMAHLSCGLLLSSGVFGFPDLFYPTLSTSLFTTSLPFSGLLQSSAWSSLLSYLGLHRFHDLADTFTTGS